MVINTQRTQLTEGRIEAESKNRKHRERGFPEAQAEECLERAQRSSRSLAML